MKFKVGDKVTLREDSRWFGKGNNPDCVGHVGEIICVDPNKTRLPISVKWASLYETFYYSKTDLNLVWNMKKPENTKSNLEDGAVVECLNGIKYLVWLSQDRFFSGDGFMKISSYNDDLKVKEGCDPDWDIVRIYRVNHNNPLHKLKLPKESTTLVWSRKEPRVTVDLTQEQYQKAVDAGIIKGDEKIE